MHAHAYDAAILAARQVQQTRQAHGLGGLFFSRTTRPVPPCSATFNKLATVGGDGSGPFSVTLLVSDQRCSGRWGERLLKG